MVRFAGGVVRFRLAVEEHVWTWHPRPEHKSMTRISRVAALHEIELALDSKSVPATAGQLGYGIEARTVLDRYPFCAAVDRRYAVTKMFRRQIPRPRVLHVI